MLQYLDHCKAILQRGGYKENRTGIDTISLFGYQNEYDLSEGFPLLTTKKMAINSVIHELIWFLRGDTNIKYLVDNDVHIWDGNAFQHHLKRQALEKNIPMYSPEWHAKLKEYIERIKSDESFAKVEGELGGVYGQQWRHWKTSDGREIDQINDLVDLLKKSPQSRRMVVSAWNPEEIPTMALPPCHAMFHVNVLNGKLDLQLYQRSCDMFLGVPFNIASYAMLAQILANQSGLGLGRFIHSFGDSHIYCGADDRGKWYKKMLSELRTMMSDGIQKKIDFIMIKKWIESNAPAETPGKERQDHVPQTLEQLDRIPKDLPQIKIAEKPFDELTIEDFTLTNYDPYPPLKGAMAV